jgi:hypothetical protein
MRNLTFARFVSSIAIAGLLNLGFMQTAVAAGIDTATVVQLEDRSGALGRIDAQLARDDVRAALVTLGVDPAQAAARVGALTDAEVAMLDQELAQLPAAGDAGWILLVIVLGILIYLFATGKLRMS